MSGSAKALVSTAAIKGYWLMLLDAHDDLTTRRRVIMHKLGRGRTAAPGMGGIRPSKGVGAVAPPPVLRVS
eukprot:620983-Prorocentrum_minimum.AAC.1